jgi:hypothetical protein
VRRTAPFGTLKLAKICECAPSAAAQAKREESRSFLKERTKKLLLAAPLRWDGEGWLPNYLLHRVTKSCRVATLYGDR